MTTNHGIAHFYREKKEILAASQLPTQTSWRRNIFKKIEPAQLITDERKLGRTSFPLPVFKKSQMCSATHYSRFLQWCVPLVNRTDTEESWQGDPGYKGRAGSHSRAKVRLQSGLPWLAPFCRDCSILALPTCTYQPPLLGGFFRGVETQHPRSLQFMTWLLLL